MPYKDTEKRTQAVRDYRERQKGITSGGITEEKSQGITLLSRPNGEPYDPSELAADGRKRYMGPLSDGQALDRLTVTIPGFIGIFPNLK